jgi:hypothetical protein
MDGNRFDTTIKHLVKNASRRQMVAGLLAGAVATFAGASILEAKNTKIKKAKKQKVSFCHRTGNGSYRFITVSESASKAHLDHGDVACEPTACQTLSGSCEATTGACTLTPAEEGTECGPGLTCDAFGNCCDEFGICV